MSLDVDHADRIIEFERALDDCQKLYHEAARESVRLRPQTDEKEAEQIGQLMLDLHRGLLVKIFVEIAQSDWSWNQAERDLAAALLAHVWNVRVPSTEIRPALERLVDTAGQLRWEALVGPFERLPHLRERVADLEAVIVRVANLIAKIDGEATQKEIERIEWIRSEVRRLLMPVTIDDIDLSDSGDATQAKAKIDFGPPPLPGQPPPPPPGDLSEPAGEELLAQTLDELNALVGLTAVKRDVEELANFLKVQVQRAAYGLPRTNVNLHMVFSGNPGTGKTSVARLMGRIFKALGILKTGHLVETDRSGLVAGYSGQTSPKTHRKIDEALDGVLFIDEAYSLVAQASEDPYGMEVLQALLKRMEDDRERLVVVLAGYPAPMEHLLRANPGLASRFNRRLTFPDYMPAELGQIFESMCQQHHYVLPTATRLKLLVGFCYLCARRDERFGNGRLARNVFETTIRRLANRIVEMKNITRELLTTVEAEDVLMDGVPQEVWKTLAGDARRWKMMCPGCAREARFTSDMLGHTVICNKCSQKFRASWGQLVE